MNDMVKLVLQIGLLCLVSEASNFLAGISGLPIPGNVVGVILLFFLLLTGALKLHQIERGADFLVRHLVFFFIPMVVGLMNYGWVFTEYGLPLGWVILVSVAVPFWVVGRLAQRLHARAGGK